MSVMEVVSEKGLVVRSAVSLKSEAAATRLAFGALIKVIEEAGERLRFQKLSGDGPAEGWVSMHANNKALLKPFAKHAAGESKATADMTQVAEEEVAKQQVEEEAAAQQATEEAKGKAEKEAATQMAVVEEAKQKAEEEATAKKAAEEEAKQRAEEEAAAQKAAEEAKQKAEEEAAVQRAAEEEAQQKAEEEAAAQKAAAEAKQRIEQEVAAQKAAEELAKQKAEEEAAAQKATEEAKQKAKEEEAATRKAALEEAKQKAEEEAAAQKAAAEACDSAGSASDSQEPTTPGGSDTAAPVDSGTSETPVLVELGGADTPGSPVLMKWAESPEPSTDPVKSPQPVKVNEDSPATSVPFEIEAGTGGVFSNTVPEPRAASTGEYRPMVRVANGYVFIYGKIEDVIVKIAVQIENTYEGTVATAMGGYGLVNGAFDKYRSQVSGMLEKYGARVQGTTLMLKGRITNGILKVKVSAIKGRDVIVSRATSGYDKVTSAPRRGYTSAMAIASDEYELTKTRTLAIASCLSGTVQRIPGAVCVKNGFIRVQGKACNLVVCLKANTMYVQGRVGDAAVLLKVKGVATYDLAAVKATSAFDSVVTAIEPYTRRAAGGFLAVKGKVNGYAVHIRATGAAGVDLAVERVRSACEIVKNGVASKLLAVQDKVKSGATMVTDTAHGMVIHVKGGYVYVVSTVSGKTVYIRAKITTVVGTVKVKVVEAYVQADVLEKPLRDYLANVLEQTKTRAADKPVVVSAISGAVIVGGGGVAAGGVAGGLAGATLGLPMALFTFGLSIPVMGMVGGGAGACAGAVIGGTAGAVSGGAAGYGYGHRTQIKSGIDDAFEKAGAYTDAVRKSFASKFAKAKRASE